MTSTILLSAALFSTGPTIASSTFAEAQSGNSVDGQITISRTGTDRYAQLEAFDDVSDGSTGGSGVLGFNVVGAMLSVVPSATVPTGSFQKTGDVFHKYCFAAGTQVLLADGATRAIEKMEVGMMVLAAPENDAEATPTACRVMEVYHNDPAKLMAVGIGLGDQPIDPEPILATAGHPFYVRGKGWVKVGDLVKGDALRTDAGDWAKVRSVSDTGRIEPVYNLQVEASHTYFVRPAGSTKAVLVHNDSGDDNPLFVWHPGSWDPTDPYSGPPMGRQPAEPSQEAINNYNASHAAGPTSQPSPGNPTHTAAVAPINTDNAKGYVVGAQVSHTGSEATGQAGLLDVNVKGKNAAGEVNLDVQIANAKGYAGIGGIGASATATKVDANGTLGSKNAGLVGSAGVSALDADASASWGKDHSIGLKAEATAADVTANGGVSILGFPIVIEVTARAGVAIGGTVGENTGFDLPGFGIHLKIGSAVDIDLKKKRGE